MTKKIHFESPIFALYDKLAKLGKHPRTLIFCMKNWVAEGVASEVNDFNQQVCLNVKLFGVPVVKGG